MAISQSVSVVLICAKFNEAVSEASLPGIPLKHDLIGCLSKLSKYPSIQLT
jgi:hypothetical protein